MDQVSSVRSVSMDNWALEEVLSMLEGGNGQLAGFFTRHHLAPSCPMRKSSPNKQITSTNVNQVRYKTKAAQFYRQQMEIHVTNVIDAGPYRGRAHSRQLSK